MPRPFSNPRVAVHWDARTLAPILDNIPIILTRRLRQAPTISSEGREIRHDAFGLALQTGIGNLTEPGVLPMVVMQYSDDGGATWSDELRQHAGPMGRYATELFWTRLGSAANRVYRVWMTDPCFWVIVAARLSTQRGRF